MKQTETATLGGGCFWCVEAVYQRVEGVLSVKPGYAGGHINNPTYKDVCSGNTGHAEVAKIEFKDTDYSGIIDYLSNERDFSRERIQSSLNRLKHNLEKRSHTLEQWF